MSLTLLKRLIIKLKNNISFCILKKLYYNLYKRLQTKNKMGEELKKNSEKHNNPLQLADARLLLSNEEVYDLASFVLDLGAFSEWSRDTWKQESKNVAQKYEDFAIRKWIIKPDENILDNLDKTAKYFLQRGYLFTSLNRPLLQILESEKVSTDQFPRFRAVWIENTTTTIHYVATMWSILWITSRRWDIWISKDQKFIRESTSRIPDLPPYQASIEDKLNGTKANEMLHHVISKRYPNWSKFAASPVTELTFPSDRNSVATIQQANEFMSDAASIDSYSSYCIQVANALGRLSNNPSSFRLGYTYSAEYMTECLQMAYKKTWRDFWTEIKAAQQWKEDIYTIARRVIKNLGIDGYTLIKARYQRHGVVTLRAFDKTYKKLNG